MRIHHHTPAEALANLKAHIAAHPARPTRALSDDEVANEDTQQQRGEDERHMSPSEGDHAAGVYEDSLGRWTA